MFDFFSFRCVRTFSKCSKVFWCFWWFCIIDWYFEYYIRIMCLFLNIWSWQNVFFYVPEVWTIFVRIFLGDILGILGPKWSPCYACVCYTFLSLFMDYALRRVRWSHGVMALTRWRNLCAHGRERHSQSGSSKSRRRLTTRTLAFLHCRESTAAERESSASKKLNFGKYI